MVVVAVLVVTVALVDIGGVGLASGLRGRHRALRSHDLDTRDTIPP
jgi:hypothetical protein